MPGVFQVEYDKSTAQHQIINFLQVAHDCWLPGNYIHKTVYDISRPEKAV